MEISDIAIQKSKILGPGGMIFLIVGSSANIHFDRLIEKMDEIAGKIEEEVIMQIGDTKYQPKNCKYVRYVPFEKIVEFLKKARVLVCHGGTGSIITGLNNGVQVIVVPRSKDLNEITDDHQNETAFALEKIGLVRVANDVNDLEDLLLDESHSNEEYSTQKNLLINNLKNYINSIQ